MWRTKDVSEINHAIISPFFLLIYSEKFLLLWRGDFQRENSACLFAHLLNFFFPG